MDRSLGTPPDPEGVASRLAILEILAMHSRGLDRREAECVRSAYWPDAIVDYGSFKGNAHSFADLVVAVLGKNYEMTQHLLGNTLFYLDGDHAKTETYVTAHHLLNGGREDLFYSGRYLDVLNRRGGCWKLSARTVVMDWSRRLEVEDERMTEAFVDLAKGTNDESDPIHAFWPGSDR